MGNAAKRLCCGTKVGYPHNAECVQGKEIDAAVKAIGESVDNFREKPSGETSGETAAAGHPAFLAILDEIRALHCRKALDYGTATDLFSNMRTDDFGVEAWRYAVLQCKNKMKRLQAYCQNGRLANEGVEDSFLDLAAYAIIGLALYREAKHGSA